MLVFRTLDCSLRGWCNTPQKRRKRAYSFQTELNSSDVLLFLFFITNFAQNFGIYPTTIHIHVLNRYWSLYISLCFPIAINSAREVYCSLNPVVLYSMVARKAPLSDEALDTNPICFPHKIPRKTKTQFTKCIRPIKLSISTLYGGSKSPAFN